ncbi:hypothetical protein ID866_6207 [Astraeus odoratus]|nr:hypothetical protein ID866_6207 [Astraeus odoratus]
MLTTTPISNPSADDHTLPSRTPHRSRTLSPTCPLSSQVGGHEGVQTTEDGSLLLKPALPREVAFYQLVRDGIAPGVDASTVATSGLNALLPWIPKFLGVLSLEGRLEDSGSADALSGLVTMPPKIVPAKGTYAPTQTLVLENLTHGFHKPCILDVKLGTVLYDEDAPQEKKERMIRVAKQTTSLTTGIRLTGFQVYANDHPDPLVIPKVYGKTIKPEQLPEGIARFFPVRSVSPSFQQGSQGGSSSASSPDAIATLPIQPGLPPSILLTLLPRLLTALERLRSALAEAEVRMVGGSVLIIYEGDWTRAELAAKASSNGSAPTTTEDDDDEEVEVEVDEQGQIVFDTVMTDSDDDDDDEQPPRFFTVSLIDFAHTRLVPGQGPDAGVLLGVDTLLRLIRDRYDTIRALDPA